MSRRRSIILVIGAMLLLSWLPLYEGLKNREWLFLIVFSTMAIAFGFLFGFSFTRAKEKARKINDQGDHH